MLSSSSEGDPAGFSPNCFATRSLALVWETEYSGICTEKGLPVESQGRKATGLRAHAYDSGAARYSKMQSLRTRAFFCI
jgi:hypothetical protein